MQISRQQLRALNDEDLSLIATADAGTHPDETVLAAWEELAARDVIIDFIEQQGVLKETALPDLVTVATFRNYVKAQFAQTRLLASGMQAFLFDDNTIRMNWFWATALGFIKLRVPTDDVADALEILNLEPLDQVGRL